MALSKSIKLWLLISSITFLIYNIWDLSISIEFIVDSLANFEADSTIAIMIQAPPLIGLILRFVGSGLLTYVCYQLWMGNIEHFLEMKNTINKALLMEIIYFVSIIPNFIFIIIIGTPMIFVSYILQTLLFIPFLFILRKKIKRNIELTVGFELRKWIGLSFVAYLGAIWINHITRWFDMAFAGGIPVLFRALNPLGSLNSFIVLSLALIFAVMVFLNRNKDGLISKWFGLSMSFLGLHFIILTIFYLLYDKLNEVYLFEIWTIPLLGLGIAILMERK